MSNYLIDTHFLCERTKSSENEMMAIATQKYVLSFTELCYVHAPVFQKKRNRCVLQAGSNTKQKLRKCLKW